MTEVWQMTAQVAAMAFVLSVGIAVLIFTIRVVLKRFLRESDKAE